VLNEWSNAVVTMNQERWDRQRNAERRVDIAGGGGGAGGRKPMTSKDIDYRQMSDADILNLQRGSLHKSWWNAKNHTENISMPRRAP
jgi:hypothetical protein